MGKTNFGNDQKRVNGVSNDQWTQVSMLARDNYSSK